jgi:type VI secretion system secreted protein Hcp
MLEALINLKRRWLLNTLLLGVACFLGSSSAGAQNNYSILMNLPGIPGESTDQTYPGWVSIREFHEGLINSGAYTIPAMDRIEIMKGLDKSSPFLRELALSSKILPSVEIILRKFTGEKWNPAFRVLLENVNVESVETVFQGTGSSMLEEKVILKFSKIKWIYTPIKADGSPGTSECAWHDFAKNETDQYCQ